MTDAGKIIKDTFTGVKVNVDASGATSGIKQFTDAADVGLKAIASDIANVVTGATTLGREFQAATATINKSVNEQRSALAGLIAGGKEGSPEYQAILGKLKVDLEEKKKLQAAFAQAEKATTDEVKERSSGIGDIVKQALGFAGGGVILSGFAGAISSFGKLYEAGQNAVKSQKELELAFSQAGLSGAALDSQVSRTAGFVANMARQFGAAPAEIRGLTKEAAVLGNATGQLNEDFVKTAYTIQQASGGMVDATRVVKIFSRGLSDPENINSLNLLKKQFPALSSSIELATTPMERLRLISLATAGAQKTLAEQAQSPERALDRLKDSLDRIKGAVGKSLFQAISPLLEIFNKLSDAIFTNIKPAFDVLPKIAAGVGAALKPIAAAASVVFGVVTSVIGSGISVLIGGLKFLVNAITPFITAIEVVGAVLGGLVVYASLGSIIAGLGAAWTAVVGVFTAGAGILTGAFSTLSASVAAGWAAILSPVGLIVAGIVVLVAGFVLAYKYITPFRDAIDGLVDGAKEIFAATVPLFAELGSVLISIGSLLFQVLIAPLRLLFTVFAAIGSVILQAVGGFFKFGSAAKDTGTFVQKFTGYIADALEWLQRLNAVAAGVSAVFVVIQKVIGDAVNALAHLDFKGIISAFSGVGDKVGKAFNEGFNKQISANEEAEAAATKVAEATSAIGESAKLSAMQIEQMAAEYEGIKQKVENDLKKRAGAESLLLLRSDPVAIKKEIERLENQKNDAGKIYDKQVVDAKGNAEQLKKIAADRAKFLSDVDKQIGDTKKQASNAPEQIKQLKEEAQGLLQEKNRQARIDANVSLETDKNKQAALKLQRLKADLDLRQDEETAAAGRITNLRNREQKLLDLKTAYAIKGLQAQIVQTKGETGISDSERATKLKELNDQLVKAKVDAAKEQQALTAKYAKEDYDYGIKLEVEKNKAVVELAKANVALLIAQDVESSQKRAASREVLAKAETQATLRTFVDAQPEYQKILKTQVDDAIAAGNLSAEQALKLREELYTQYRSRLSGGDETAARQYQSIVKARSIEEAKAAREAQYEIENARIKTIEDVAQREAAQRIANAKKIYDEELIAAGTNATLLEEAEIKRATETTDAKAALFIAGTTNTVEHERRIQLAAATKQYLNDKLLLARTTKEKLNIVQEYADAQAKIEEEASKRLSGDEELGNLRRLEERKLKLAREFAEKRKDIELQAIRAVNPGYDYILKGLDNITAKLDAKREDYDKQKADLLARRDEDLAAASGDYKKRIEIQKKYFEDAQILDKKYIGTAAVIRNIRAAVGETFADIGKKNENAFKESTKGVQKFSELASNSITQLATAFAASTASLIASGDGVGKALAKSAFNALNSIVPILIAQIFGQSIAQLGPIAGPIAGALLTAGLYTLVAVARGALGFKKGGYTGDGAPDDTAGVVHKSEFVSTAKTTQRERPLLEFLHKGGSSKEYFERVIMLNNRAVNASPKIDLSLIAAPRLRTTTGTHGGNNVIVLNNANNVDVVNALARLEREMREVKLATKSIPKSMKSIHHNRVEIVHDKDSHFKAIQRHRERQALG